MESNLLGGAVEHKPELLDEVRRVVRLKHFSIRTEEADTDWIRRFIVFQDRSHPKEKGAEEIERLLSYLAWRPRAEARRTRRGFLGGIWLRRSRGGLGGGL